VTIAFNWLTEPAAFQL